jgi:hypothetical protein
MIQRTYDGTLSTDGHIQLKDAPLPDRKMRVLVTVLGPEAEVRDEPPTTYEPHLRTMPEVDVVPDLPHMENQTMDPWTELPGPQGGVKLVAHLGRPIVPDVPDIPDAEESE